MPSPKTLKPKVNPKTKVKAKTVAKPAAKAAASKKAPAKAVQPTVLTAEAPVVRAGGRDWQSYFLFTGRLGRLDFLLASVALLLIAALVHVALLPLLGPLGMVLGVMTSVAVVWVGLALMVKRLNDLGWSPYWVLLHFVPIAGLVLLALLLLVSGNPQAAPRDVRGAVLAVVAVVVMLFLVGMAAGSYVFYSHEAMRETMPMAPAPMPAPVAVPAPAVVSGS